MRRDTTSRIGERYGMLTILERAETLRRGAPRWKCRCDCGSDKVVELGALRRGLTKSCGCFNRTSEARASKHGGAKRGQRDRLHYVWTTMKQRCSNPSDPNYHRYGGRGITVCPQWADDFAAFAIDVGERPSPNHSLDRIDNNGGYHPGNVRWASRREQMRNTSGCRAVIRSDGERYSTVVEAAEAAGVHPSTISAVCRGSRKTSGGFSWSYAATLRAIKENDNG